jgi:hypothetical protein
VSNANVSFLNCCNASTSGLIWQNPRSRKRQGQQCKNGRTSEGYITIQRAFVQSTKQCVQNRNRAKDGFQHKILAIQFIAQNALHGLHWIVQQPILPVYTNLSPIPAVILTACSYCNTHCLLHATATEILCIWCSHCWSENNGNIYQFQSLHNHERLINFRASTWCRPFATILWWTEDCIIESTTIR